MWMAVLYGVYGSDDMIVQVALSQIGNVGGEPYWSWYGFGSVLNGVLALYLGVQINAVISTRVLYLNMPDVIMVWTGSRKEDNGLIILLNLRPA